MNYELTELGSRKISVGLNVALLLTTVWLPEPGPGQASEHVSGSRGAFCWRGGRACTPSMTQILAHGARWGQ